MLLAIVFNKFNIDPDKYKKLKFDLTSSIETNPGVDLVIIDSVAELADEVNRVGTRYDQISIVQKEEISKTDAFEFKNNFSDIVANMSATGLLQIIDKSQSLKGLIAEESLHFSNLKYIVIDKITKTSLTSIILGTKVGQVDDSLLKSVDINEVIENKARKEEEAVPIVEEEEVPVIEEEVPAIEEEVPVIEEEEEVIVRADEVSVVIGDANDIDVVDYEESKDEDIVVPFVEDDSNFVETKDRNVDNYRDTVTEVDATVVDEDLTETEIEGTVNIEKTQSSAQNNTENTKVMQDDLKKSKGFLSNIFSRKKNRVDNINDSAQAIKGKAKDAVINETKENVSESVNIITEEYTANVEVYNEPAKLVSKKKGNVLIKNDYEDYSFIKQPKVICVTGAGTHGKSTIASSLAATVAGMYTPTCLIDMDLNKRMQSYIFDYSLATDRQRRNGLPELIKNKGFASPEFYVNQPYANLDILGGSYEMDDKITDISTESLTSIVYGLLTTHRLVVVDLPWNYIVKNPSIVSLFHNILYVTTADLFGVIDVDTNISLNTFPQTFVDKDGNRTTNMNYCSLVYKLGIILNKVTPTIGISNNSYVKINKRTFIDLVSETLDDNSIDPIKKVPVISEIPVIPGIGNILTFNTPASYLQGDECNIGEVVDSLMRDLLKQI